MIKKETIQTIIETARIEEVVGEFVSLKRRGVNYIGLCPFHNEKTPSFTVSPAKGIYKCFGCGASGNAVGFVMAHEHYSYPEALKYIAKKYGIEVKEEEITPEDQEKMDNRESMFALNNFISKYFQDNLFNSEEGKSIALSYLKERSFLESTIKKFQLGYALNGWDIYSNFAIKNGYNKDVLVKTGLSIDKESRLIDRFKGRVIFPIHNLTGKIIGFGGRILSSEKSTAKYLNSPESDIYNKSKSLYGIYFARNSILKKNNCFLVEGYTDVISLHQAGIENVVASSGTSLTIEQIKLIRRFTPNITILYDGDPAGIKASFRGIDLILTQGMNVKVVLFPEGEDPDSFARTHSSTEIVNFLKESASDFITFKARLLLDETKGDPAAKAELIKEIVRSIAFIPDPIVRSVYIKECSAVMDMAEQTLMNGLNKILRDKFRKHQNSTVEYSEEDIVVKKNHNTQVNNPFDIASHEDQIIRLILLYGKEIITLEDIIIDENDQEIKEKKEITVADFILENIQKDEIIFTNKVYKKILNEYAEEINKGNLPGEEFFVNHPDKFISDTVINLIASPYELSDNWKKHQIYVLNEQDNLYKSVITTILSLRSKVISRNLKEITDKLKDLESDAEIFVLQQQFYELKKIAAEIDRELKRTFNY